MAAIHLAGISAGSSARSNPSLSFASPPPAHYQRFAAFNRVSLSCSSCIGNQSESLLRSVVTKRRHGGLRCAAVSCSVGKLSETELLPVPPERLEEKIPSGAGVYGVYDGNGELQFIGISRNLIGSIDFHRKTVPDLCHSVKIGLVDSTVDRTVLTDTWKSWMQEHIDVNGKPPSGNLSGNNTWTRRQKTKADLRLTPGRHVTLTVPLEDLIDRLVKENKVVAFIKGSRSAPQCGFSQRVVAILESNSVDYETVNVLDEDYNFGLRETLKAYSNWPTFPQIFVRGELIGGCDILTAMDTSGELSQLFKN